MSTAACRAQLQRRVCSVCVCGVCSVCGVCCVCCVCCSSSGPSGGHHTLEFSWISASHSPCQEVGSACSNSRSVCGGGARIWGKQKVFVAAPLAHSHICCLPGLQLAAVRSCLLLGQINSLVGRAEGLAGWMDDREEMDLVSQPWCCQVPPEPQTRGHTVPGHTPRAEAAGEGGTGKRCLDCTFAPTASLWGAPVSQDV